MKNLKRNLWKFFPRFFLFLSISLLFFSLRSYALPGGDSNEVCTFASSELMFYFRSPLTVLLHQLAYRLLSPADWTPAEVIALCSSIAGAFYVVALTLISTNIIFLLFNLTAPFIFIFISHVEHYAWVNMWLTWFIYFVHRFLKGETTLIPAVMLFLLASAFHHLALFYLPALIFLTLAIKKENQKLKISLAPHISEGQAKRILLIFMAYFLLMGISPFIFFSALRGLDVGSERLCPLFYNPNPVRFYFTMFQWKHIEMFLYFIKMSSPLALPLIVLLSPWFFRGRFYSFLLVMTLSGLVWAFLWHPDMGRADWDLFGSFAIPANILAGLMLKDLYYKFSKSLNS